MNSAKLLQWVSVLAAAAGTLIGAIAVLRFATGSPYPIGPSGASPPAPWASASILLIGLGLLALTRRPGSGRMRRAVIGAASLTLILSLVSLGTHLSSGVLSPVLAALHATRPLGGATLFLASASLLTTAIGRGRILGALLGLLVFGIGFVICLGFIYGGPLVAGHEWAPVSLTSAVAALVIGTGLVTAAGPHAWPNDVFIGDSVSAVMLRWLVPLMALAIIATDIADARLFENFSRAVGSVLNTTISVAVTLTVISYLQRGP